MLSKLWVGFLALSLIFGVVTGRLDAVSAAAATGAASAVELILKIAGLMCPLVGRNGAGFGFRAGREDRTGCSVLPCACCLEAPQRIGKPWNWSART